MTKKDFKLIADVLYRHRPIDSVFPLEAVHHDGLTKAMADALATTNPRFDRNRFIKACKGEK